jgi:dihydrofolate synthase/folylpolyglutamate synthase
MTYAEATAYLYGLRRFGWRPGLETVRQLLALVGNPQESFPSIHIGGTNGKGSVGAMTAAILSAAGYRTGLYTSPHLRSFTERIQVDGTPIGEPEVAALTGRLAAVAGRHFAAGTGPPPPGCLSHPTFFELTTAMAFLHFAARNVGAAVVEVGLGGRLDATNVVVPEVAAITNVTLEHEAYLGRTVAEIAAEKAGIVKPGVPVVTAATGEALAIIRRVATEREAPVIEVPKAYAWHVRASGLEGLRLDLSGPAGPYSDLFVPLAGRHQAENAALAVAVAETLATQGFRIDRDGVRHGLAATRWPGRLQTAAARPRVLLDGAHNPAGIEVLERFLVEQQEALGRLVLVFGVLADKDWRAMLAPLLPFAGTLILTRPPGERGTDPAEVAAGARGQHPDVRVETDPEAALALARALAGAAGTVLVAGSLYLVGAVLGKLEQPAG